MTQMVSVHVMAMRCAPHQQPRPATQRRARIGPARPHVSRPDRGAEPLPEPGRACHHRAERVGRDGGKAIVGNVTQHASVIVSDKNPASAARKLPKAVGLQAGTDC